MKLYFVGIEIFIYFQNSNSETGYIIRIIKSGRLSWIGGVACMVKMIKVLRILIGETKGRGHNA
jgi:hypothetical protein